MMSDATLHITLPQGEERSVSITGSPINIGRTEDNDVVLPHPLVSRRHARILLEDNRILLIDLNSTNGTAVGGTDLSPNEPYTLSYEEPFEIEPFILWMEPAPARPEVPVPEGVDDDKVSIDEKPAKGEPEAADGDEQPPAEQPSVRIGVEAIPQVPPTPPSEPPAPPGENGRPPYDDAFGLPEDQSRYLAHLPPMYEDHPFLGQFLLAFEGVLTPIEQIVDNYDLYLDPHEMPAFFLEQLALWLGLTLDEKWPTEKRRALLAEAAELYRRRGTKWSLSRHLEIYTGARPDITEPEDRPHHFYVELRAPRGAHIDRETVDRIIQVNKPAHTTYSFEILRG